MAFKGGRVDALQGGDFGVPEPFGTLHEHLDRADIFGFDQTEFIQLTACGHTVGARCFVSYAFQKTSLTFSQEARTMLDSQTSSPSRRSHPQIRRAALRLMTPSSHSIIMCECMAFEHCV